jgi:hypothetical protein
MKTTVTRQTIDLTAYPDLVVVYLGMQVHSLRGLWTLFKIGPQINRAVEAQPEGLLLHEQMLFSLFPPHLGMRQYWRNYEALEAWTRALPHRQWWQNFLRDSGGTGFWHETYFMRGGMEAIYDDVRGPLGMRSFAPVRPARGPQFSSRQRLGIGGTASSAAPLPESELYELKHE